uniref:Uncharacterized protein n=1 Tax=Panagrellus redivivus TaxID=6233 RepID=A0A7E4W1R3_PANRE
MTTSTKLLSLMKRIYILIKHCLTSIISTKHANNHCPKNDRLSEPYVYCITLQNLPLFARNTYDQVFITDSDEMYQWASKDTHLFKMFKSLQQFKRLRFFLDGMISIHPCWQSVLKTDEVFIKNVPFDITDTLILHCESIETYSKVIPRIRGSYSILILHGNTTWNQIKQLYHLGVKQIRINATFEITPSEHDEFVNFIKKHCRGINYKFIIAYEAKCPMDILQKLYKAYDSDRSYYLDLNERGYYFIHHRSIQIWLLFNTFCFLLSAGIVYLVLLSSTICDELDDDGRKLVFAAIMIIVNIVTSRISLTAPMDIKNEVKQTPIDCYETVKVIKGK